MFNNLSGRRGPTEEDPDSASSDSTLAFKINATKSSGYNKYAHLIPSRGSTSDSLESPIDWLEAAYRKIFGSDGAVDWLGNKNWLQKEQRAETIVSYNAV